LDWSLSSRKFPKDKLPKPLASRTAVNKNLFLNSRLNQQRTRQSRMPYRATAANGVAAGEDGAVTKARASSLPLPGHPLRFPFCSRRWNLQRNRSLLLLLLFVLLFPRNFRKAGRANHNPSAVLKP